MKNQAEFKALVEQKMKQQRQAARIRRQQWTAWGASAGVLILVVGISFYFLKNPVELPLLPEDNITDTETQYVEQSGSWSPHQKNEQKPLGVEGIEEPTQETPDSTAEPNNTTGGSTESGAGKGTSAGAPCDAPTEDSTEESDPTPDPITQAVSENDIDNCIILCPDPSAISIDGLREGLEKDATFTKALFSYLYEAAFDVEEEQLTAATHDALDGKDILLKVTFLAEDKTYCVLTLTPDYTMLWHTREATDLRTLTPKQQSQLRYTLALLMQTKR